MNRGYIRVWRKMEDSGIMGNPEICRLFLFLLLRASSLPRRQMIGNSLVALEPGQVVVGRKKLAADLGTTEAKARSGLDALAKMGIISQRSTNKFTIISLVNWGKYQADPHETNAAWAGSDVEESLPDEFVALRGHYDAHARREAPASGLAEYRQCMAARVWPGLAAITAAVDNLAKHEGAWRRGYAPGLARFLRERQWRKKPAPEAARVAHGRETGGDPAIMNNLNTAARVLASRQGSLYE